MQIVCLDWDCFCCLCLLHLMFTDSDFELASQLLLVFVNTFANIL